MPPNHDQEGYSASHERIVNEIVQQMETMGCLHTNTGTVGEGRDPRDTGGLHTGHQTDGMFGNAKKWVERGGERFSKGFKKYREDSAVSSKKSTLGHYNLIEQGKLRNVHLTPEQRAKMVELRFWFWNQLKADLQQAVQDRTLTPEERTDKQERIDDMQERWRLWTDDEIYDRKVAKLQGYEGQDPKSLTEDNLRDMWRILEWLIELKKTQLENTNQDGTLTAEERRAKQNEVDNLEKKLEKCKASWKVLYNYRQNQNLMRLTH